MCRGLVSRCAFVLLISLSAGNCFAQVGGDSIIHDPSRIIKEGSRYYVYLTGLGGADGIFFKYSDDLATWHDPGGNAVGNAILRDAPPWVATEVPDNEGTFWAPSILKYEDEYRLYYSVSVFGVQQSAIGLATSPTLDYLSPNYAWTDHGPVITSTNNEPYNAIDPSVFVDPEERMWMTFGSFETGVFLTELNPSTGKALSTNPAAATRVAAHPPGNAIEAPYIHYRDGYYYLFVNWGFCCNGVDSTYEIRVGRSDSPTGPFFDRGEVPTDMVNGGGTLFLESAGTMIGPGHMGIFSEDGTDYFGYHFYDATSDGLPRYNIDTLLWDPESWPVALSEVLAADLTGDSTVNNRDWHAFSSNHLVDLSAYPAAQQARRGDLDGDGDNDFGDFVLFSRYYDLVNGEGAMAALLAVPEPSTVLLTAASLLFCASGMVRTRVRRR